MTKSFTFSLGDSSVMMSHLALQQEEVALAISKTPEWTEDQTMTAEVKINGIEIPARSFEELLDHWAKSLQEQIEAQLGFLERANAVETAAQHLLKVKVSDLMNKMIDLDNHLDDIDFCEMLK